MGAYVWSFPPIFPMIGDKERAMSSSGKNGPSGRADTCFYFDTPGPRNTEKTLAIALEYAESRSVSDILVASTSGRTGLAAARMFQDKNCVVVSHSTGFVKPDFQQMAEETRRDIEALGARVLTCQHALGGVGRAVRKKLGTYELEEIIAYTLRMFGQGTKVAVECALMAADAGLISTGRECLSIGGTESGADTALLLKPAHAQDFFDCRITKFLAKPRLNT
jgi:hypothetical protein